MSDLLVGLGIALALEGTFYALLPGRAREAVRRALDGPEGRIRVLGLAALAAGVAIVWLVRR
ncbi:MAG: DUF2065 domain-containing protein [Bauldia sp.]|nr:DUF2065 domain-containing protein [Bauldia sp.]MCW5716446.1 DUF2065 domain-containing protein [Bauldia sp.]